MQERPLKSSKNKILSLLIGKQSAPKEEEKILQQARALQKDLKEIFDLLTNKNSLTSDQKKSIPIAVIKINAWFQSSKDLLKLFAESSLYDSIRELLKENLTLLDIPLSQVSMTSPDSNEAITAENMMNVFVSEIKGRRESQEDSFIAMAASELKEFDEKEIPPILFATTQALHTKMVEKKDIDLATVGSTFSAALICNNKIYHVNVGDSAVFMAIRNVKEQISVKAITQRLHNPEDPEEAKRLISLGSGVNDGRVFGLALSRAFGDLGSFSMCGSSDKAIKNWKIGKFCQPDIYIMSFNLAPGSKAILFNICDGVTETVAKYCSFSEALPKSTAYLEKILKKHWKEKTNLEILVKAIKNQAYLDGSGDNITVMGGLITNELSKSKPTFMILADGHASDSGGDRIARFLTSNFNRILQEQIKKFLKNKKQQEKYEDDVPPFVTIHMPAKKSFS